MDRESFFGRFTRMAELPLALLALLIIPALLIEDRAEDVRLREVALAINWFVWVAFCADYVVKLALAPSRRRFVRTAWFDLLIIALSPPFLVPQTLQGVRAVRAVRILRLLRFVRAAAVAAMGLRFASDALRHRRFHYVALTTVVVVGLGAVGIFLVERGENRAIQSIGDALWWAVVTVTTVEYGDVSPVTTEGRLIAVVLMIVGIGFLGMFTATLTSLFVEREQPPASTVDRRLDRIEAKLDALIHDNAHRRSIP
jgi:voltage-gated potassium channel